MHKRILSIMLTLCMVMALLPTVAFAADPVDPADPECITLTAPFTTTVKLGDAGEPGETTFDLAIVQAGMPEEYYAHVTVSGTVTTNGAGNYTGTLNLTGTAQELRAMLCEGALVQQVNGGEANWTYDDTVWGLILDPDPSARSLDKDQTANWSIIIVPAIYENIENEPYYDINWDNIQKDAVDKMTFTNTYTAHGYVLNHDKDSHWNECACGDLQNKEAHKYGEWKVTKEATENVKGEQEHICSVCGYTETAEIALPTGTPSPATGDNSHMVLWVVLLLISGGLLVTQKYTVYKKHMVKK